MLNLYVRVRHVIVFDVYAEKWQDLIIILLNGKIKCLLFFSVVFSF